MHHGALSDALLRGAPTAPGRSGFWAYGAWGMGLVSAFIAYHLIVLLTWNTPGGGLAKEFHSAVIKHTHGRRYFTATSNTQSWAMFAPNPNRTNVFIRVLVEDHEGEEWDLHHDIWKVDRHPYWFYDRMGKVNRRIDGKKGYQKVYASWVCRDWALAHGGEAPKAVRFVKRWTRVPTTKELLARAKKTGVWGYDPWKLKNQQKEQERFECAKIPAGQLSNEVRARHGLPMVDDDGYRPTRMRTWWDKREAEAKKRAAQERRAELVGEREGGSERGRKGVPRAGGRSGRGRKAPEG